MIQAQILSPSEIIAIAVVFAFLFVSFVIILACWLVIRRKNKMLDLIIKGMRNDQNNMEQEITDYRAGADAMSSELADADISLRSLELSLSQAKSDLTAMEHTYEGRIKLLNDRLSHATENNRRLALDQAVNTPQEYHAAATGGVNMVNDVVGRAKEYYRFLQGKS